MEYWSSGRQFDVDAYVALVDFIRYGFYRNRKDELAHRYIEQAQKALDEITQSQSNPAGRVALLEGKGDHLSDIFGKRVKDVKIGKGKVHNTDRMFLESVCDDFIPQLRHASYNIRLLCRRYFQEQDLGKLHDRLVEIKGVGKKIASLFVRDMLILYDKENERKSLEKLTKNQLLYVYPVDTWVRNISNQILGKKGVSDDQLASEIFERCEEYGVSPVYVNHGIWYVGAHSQKFLLHNLEKVDGFKVVD